jgi:hypothetical protein
MRRITSAGILAAPGPQSNCREATTVSEYQYYEFRAVDRPLTQRQMAELRELSTRAEITPTSFTNEYHYGDFRGDPRRLMEHYFDAFVYVANWGTHRVMFRLPRGLLDADTAAAYCPGESAAFWVKGKYAVVELCSNPEDGGGWEEGEGWLDRLLPLREELLNGDLRCLYLGWLLCAQAGELRDDEIEPPVPPGLGRLSPALRALADYLRIDDALLLVAAERSTGRAPAGASRDELAEWVKSLPTSEKDGILLRLLEADTPHLRAELLQTFRQARAAVRPAAAGPGVPGRMVADLLAAAETRAEEERRREEEEAARERERRQREQAAARARHLDALAGREPEAWRQVDTLIATKQPKPYDEAVQLLQDLRDVAERAGRREDFETRLGRLREQHARKPSLMERFRRAGLIS